MDLRVFSIDDYVSDLPEVAMNEYFKFGKFSKFGLFSQIIFGPIKSFNCECGRSTYRGRSTGLDVCPKCDVEITTSEKRRKQFAKIVLPFEVLNPTFREILNKEDSKNRKIMDNILFYKKFYSLDENDELVEYEPESRDGESGISDQINYSDIDLLYGPSGAKRYMDILIDKNKESSRIYKFMDEHRDKIFINNIVVIPPDFRPMGPNINGSRISDELNLYYSNVIIRSNRVKSVPYILNDYDEVFSSNYRFIQKTVNELYDYVLQKLSKKKGLVRFNILGKRLDFSGRAVISPDPTLKLDQCRIPYFMILEILKPQLASYLVTRRHCKKYNDAVKLIEQCITDNDDSLFTISKDFCNGKYCILNRQPTLHRLGMLGFKVLVHLESTIKIHPMVCTPFNADFDGDSLCSAVFIKIKHKTNKEVKDRQIVTEMSDMLDHDLFVYKSDKVRSDGVKITKYSPKSDHEITISAIDPDTGETNWKPITEYSVHENLEMYKLHDPKSRFKDFWSSTDHSLLVLDETDNKIKKVTPLELLKNPEGKYLIQEESIQNEQEDYRRVEN